MLQEPPVASDVVDPEEETARWCNRLFPFPHDDLQRLVVDYLLHGSPSLQLPNMDTLSVHVRDAVASESNRTWTSEMDLAQSATRLGCCKPTTLCGRILTEVHRRAYSKGIPNQPPLVEPRNDEVPRFSQGPVRSRYGIQGQRVAPIEDRGSVPRSITTSRMQHASRPVTRPPMGDRQRQVVQTLIMLQPPGLGCGTGRGAVKHHRSQRCTSNTGNNLVSV